MGRGIALTFACQGYEVLLLDVKDRTNEEFLILQSNAFREIEGQLDILIGGNVVSETVREQVINNIKISPIERPDVIWEQVFVLFEAVPEKLDVKKQVFHRICPLLPKEALTASTTSSFSVNDVAEFALDKEGFMNTHWLNPAYLIPLVEVSPGEKTSPAALKKMMQILERIGKVPVECSPSPGFIVPRIQALAMNEAARLVENNVASVEDIDMASRYGFGIRFAILGLLEFIDWGGADTLYHAGNYLEDSLHDKRFTPPKSIKDKMESGHIGMKTKKGFYTFAEEDLVEYQKETLHKFIDLLKHLGFFEDSRS